MLNNWNYISKDRITIFKNFSEFTLSANQIEALFRERVPFWYPFCDSWKEKRRDKFRFNKENITVGMVGYPNVGKSSTINVLIADKKVSVRFWSHSFLFESTRMYRNDFQGILFIQNPKKWYLSINVTSKKCYSWQNKTFSNVILWFRSRNYALRLSRLRFVYSVLSR